MHLDRDLFHWLSQQIDEDLLWAREASRKAEGAALDSGVHWKWVSPAGAAVTPGLSAVEYVGEPDHLSQVDLLSVEHWPNPDSPPHDASGYPQFAIPMAREVPSAVGGHILRHDPARVIRDATERKELLKRCLNTFSTGSPDARVFSCWVMKHLAAAYAERSGYDPKWNTRPAGH